jgi:GNAT superfamily N-acetyltransferase
MSILHFRKQLAAPPVAVEVPGIRVRTFVAPDDVDSWLAVRVRATGGLAPVVRPWSVDDFRREMLNKSWWRADHSWVATDSKGIIGAVILALREGSEAIVPAVHWLLVDPSSQRRGIARALMSHLELAAWTAGHREVQLETHADWRSAVAFYQSVGYATLRDRSPR